MTEGYSVSHTEFSIPKTETETMGACTHPPAPERGGTMGVRCPVGRRVPCADGANVLWGCTLGGASQGG